MAEPVRPWGRKEARSRRAFSGKLKSPCCVCYWSGNASVWVAISPLEMICGSLLPPIVTCSLPIAAGVFRRDLFYRINVSPSRFLLCANANKTFQCW